MNAAFACATYNAPGIGGPEDAPEYDGPTVEELTERNVKDADFVRMFAADVPADVFALLIAGDDFTFAHRFRHEMKKLAADAAREDFDTAVSEFEKEHA